MARPLHLIHRLSGVSQASYAATSLLLCAFALFVCASHSRKWRHRWNWKACYGCGGGFERDPVIQLASDETIHGFQCGNGEGIGRGGEVSVWQKNILMGGKCQLPDFSGVIIYDAAGKVVPSPKASRGLPCK